MQTDRSAHRIAAFPLPTAAVFDLTGAVIYRVVRSGLPEPPPNPEAGAAFRDSAAILRDAHREASSHASGRGGDLDQLASLVYERPAERLGQHQEPAGEMPSVEEAVALRERAANRLKLTSQAAPTPRPSMMNAQASAASDR